MHLRSNLIPMVQSQHFLIWPIKLDVVPIINQHIQAQRSYMPEKPLRNNLTAGITLLLAAIGRVCMPTSKRGWWSWTQATSIDYLLRVSLCRLDSQHFWDLMDCLPEDSIEKIEVRILNNVLSLYPLGNDTFLYDTTNYTYIDSANTRCAPSGVKTSRNEMI